MQGIGCVHAHSRTAVLDIDERHTAIQAFDAMGLDLEALTAGCTVRSIGNPDKGAKLWWRLPNGLVLKTLKLTRPGPKNPGTGKRDPITIFEFRAAGGQDVLPPSLHPSGHPYRWAHGADPWTAGGFPEIPLEILARWRNWKEIHPALVAIFDPGAVRRPHRKARQRDIATGGGEEAERIIAAYNARVDPAEILERNGYEQQRGRYLRPGSTTGAAGVVLYDDGAIVRSYGGDAILNPEGGEPPPPRDAFDCFRLLEHGGDWHKALVAAADLCGIERKQTQRREEPPLEAYADDVDRDRQRTLEGDAPGSLDEARERTKGKRKGKAARLPSPPTDAPEIRLDPGQLHVVVAQALAALRGAGRIFERGGELVRLASTGEVYPVTPEDMQVTLSRVARFQKYNVRVEGYVRTNPTMELSRNVLSQRGEFGLPSLIGVITAPVMRLDGSLLLDPGHDPATGLFHHRPGGASFPDIPMEPTPGEILAALRTLWHPFRLFPFVGPVDRGVFLAAILTAVARPVLPRAPAFLLNAPTAGSGKTLLAECLAVLAGEAEPTMVPPVEGDEEMRKRITAFLRSAPRAVVLDNLAGALHSPALAEFITAKVHEDRILGSSIAIKIPARALILATGNNITMVGDLNRRFFTARIDPESERPYARAFDFDPATVCRERRVGMVAAALTLLRAGVIDPGKGARVGSFPEWSEVVLDAVAVAAGAASHQPIFQGDGDMTEFGDPQAAIDNSYGQDPETAKLGALLAAWWEAFQDRPQRVADAITAAHPGTALNDALDEIAGERGTINPRRLGRWIERYKDRIVDGLRIVDGGVLHKVKQWRVQNTRDGGLGGLGGFSPLRVAISQKDKAHG